MPSTNYERKVRIGNDSYSQVCVIESRKIVSTNSPRNAKGKLVLRSNPHERRITKGLVVSAFRKDYYALGRSGVQGSLNETFLSPIMRRLENQAYAKIRGKLYKGSASLGVTAASYRQSRELIVKNYNRLNQTATSALSDIGKQIARGRSSNAVSGLYLEYLFGMAPLVQDVHAAVTSVIQQAPTTQWVKATAKTFYVEKVDRRSWGLYPSGYVDEFIGNARMSYAAMVSVENPNTWLAERAGALNFAAILWDLVPWSFVVNMFVNTGQIVNSITDFAGLSWSNGIAVRHTNGQWVGQYYITRQPWLNPESLGKTSGFYDHKLQSLEALGRPTLMAKLPDVDWELAAIAAALFNQKLGAISRMVRAVRR